MAKVRKDRHLLKGVCRRCGEHFRDTDFMVKHGSDRWHLECYIDMRDKELVAMSNVG